MEQLEPDLVINEVREVRYRISERFGHNPSKLVSYYMEMQKQYEDRLIKTETSAERKDPTDNG